MGGNSPPLRFQIGEVAIDLFDSEVVNETHSRVLLSGPSEGESHANHEFAEPAYPTQFG